MSYRKDAGRTLSESSQRSRKLINALAWLWVKKDALAWLLFFVLSCWGISKLVDKNHRYEAKLEKSELRAREYTFGSPCAHEWLSECMQVQSEYACQNAAIKLRNRGLLCKDVKQ